MEQRDNLLDFRKRVESVRNVSRNVRREVCSSFDRPAESLEQIQTVALRM
jgi:hypothetical protein